MIFKQKIPCYTLIFDQVDIIKRSLEFLSQYVDKIDLIIVENPSANTPEIKKVVDEYGAKGLIKRHYLMDENLTGNALAVAME
jgi:2-C-methyl-D-erythritol 4-phosphate cytidylyltransferase